MARFVTKQDAQRALAHLIREDVDSGTPNNDIVSVKERDALHPFVQRAVDDVRGTKPKYGRVKSEEVVDRAMTTAMASWREVNPPDRPKDYRYLAKSEIAALKKTDPALAELTLRAYEIARGDRTSAVKAAIEARPDFGVLLRRVSGFGEVIDARVGDAGRADLPDAVRRAFDVHYVVEAADRGGATLKRFALAGAPVFALYGTTDGDDQRLELFDANGAALASGRFYADRFTAWDAHFGGGRFASVVGRLGHPNVEGLSETDEQLAAGQITNDWRPDVVVNQATLRHAAGVLSSIDTPVDLPADQDEVLRATIEMAYDRTLQQAAFGMPEFELLGFGAVRIGVHHDAVDGQDYIVGDYRDSNDASFTFYFQRDVDGRLFVAREQSNG